MQGISGSGKSTVARQMAAQFEAQGGRAVVLSTDDYLMIGNEYVWNHERVCGAHSRCFRAFIESLQAGIGLVIVDNTNTRVEFASPYMFAALAFGYSARIVRVECDPIIAASRNVHGVPCQDIRRMAQELDEFRPISGWSMSRVRSRID